MSTPMMADAGRPSADELAWKQAHQRSPQRYYTPPPRPLASCERKRSLDAPGNGTLTEVTCHNVVSLTSSHGGMGLSIMGAMLAWEIVRRGFTVALVDADFVAGGLDVLLGVEGEPGMRFSQIEAPLGQLEGEALNHDLIRWEGIRVLPYDPWEARQPEWWEVRAALHALSSANDVVIADAGQGGLLETVPDLREAIQIMAVECSVLGLARARAHRARLNSWQCPKPQLVGIDPRGVPRGRGAVSLIEVQDYLSATVLGPIRLSSNLCGDVLDGLGVRSITRGSRKTIGLLADHVERMVHPDRNRREGDE